MSDNFSVESTAYLMPPTFTSTSTALILSATVKVLESTTFTLPPGVFVALTLARGNVYGFGVLFGMTLSCSIFVGGGEAGSAIWTTEYRGVQKLTRKYI
jgi:hypothetical protein